MLGVPQVFKNLQAKSTEGLSTAMIFCWLGGDIFKSLYYYRTKAPVQLVACALFQLGVDVVILWQIRMYKGRTASTDAHEVIELKRSIDRGNENGVDNLRS
eukprot:TRINITY_DN1294_c0_g3_i1.p1 TRINITY_DN1294_c0_g3~~TRINITY_DN1294_c0_g3_i1.p1  ORF type:complete len:101 (-),score=14.51 TRINITY_DN1294_c0_g3_i1:98-400(-)